MLNFVRQRGASENGSNESKKHEVHGEIKGVRNGIRVGALAKYLRPLAIGGLVNLANCAGSCTSETYTVDQMGNYDPDGGFLEAAKEDVKKDTVSSQPDSDSTDDADNTGDETDVDAADDIEQADTSDDSDAITDAGIDNDASINTDASDANNPDANLDVASDMQTDHDAAGDAGNDSLNTDAGVDAATSDVTADVNGDTENVTDSSDAGTDQDASVALDAGTQ